MQPQKRRETRFDRSRLASPSKTEHAASTATIDAQRAILVGRPTRSVSHQGGRGGTRSQPSATRTAAASPWILQRTWTPVNAGGCRRQRPGGRWARRCGLKEPVSRLPGSCCTRTRSVSPVPVSSTASRPVPAATCLRQQSMSRPALCRRVKVDRSLVSCPKMETSSHCSHQNAGCRRQAASRPSESSRLNPRPDPGQRTRGCRVFLSVSIPGGSTIHPLIPQQPMFSFHRHRDITTRPLLAGFPCPCRIGMSSSAGRGPPAGQVVTIQTSFPFFHTTPDPRREAAEPDGQQTAQ